jgi:hypothetical protein
MADASPTTTHAVLLVQNPEYVDATTIRLIQSPSAVYVSEPKTETGCLSGNRRAYIFIAGVILLLTGLALWWFLPGGHSSAPSTPEPALAQ